MKSFKQYIDETPDGINTDEIEAHYNDLGAITFAAINKNMLFYMQKVYPNDAATHGAMGLRLVRMIKSESDFTKYLNGDLAIPEVNIITLGQPKYTPKITNLSYGRDESWEVAGRLWPNKEVVSFWQTFKEVEPYMVLIVKFLEAVGTSPADILYEFIDSKKLFSWYELGLDNIPSSLRRTGSEMAAAKAAQHVASPLEKKPAISKTRPIRRGKLVPARGIQLSPGGRPIIGDSVQTFKQFFMEGNSNVSIDYLGNGIYKIRLNNKKIGQAIITRYGSDYVLSAIDIDESYQRKGYGTMLLSRIANDLKTLGVKTLSSSNEGSGTVQMLDKVFGRDNVKHYSGSEEISYEEAIKIMDKDYGYTRSVANLTGIKDPRPWV